MLRTRSAGTHRAARSAGTWRAGGALARNDRLAGTNRAAINGLAGNGRTGRPGAPGRGATGAAGIAGRASRAGGKIGPRRHYWTRDRLTCKWARGSPGTPGPAGRWPAGRGGGQAAASPAHQRGVLRVARRAGEPEGPRALVRDAAPGEPWESGALERKARAEAAPAGGTSRRNHGGRWLRRRGPWRRGRSCMRADWRQDRTAR